MVRDAPASPADLDAIRRGDEDAARRLVEELYPLVLRIVRRHLPRRLDEEDLAQMVFLKIFAGLPTYTQRPGVPFEHWVSRLAVRTCLDALRSERRRPELRWSDLTEEQAAGLEYLSGQSTDPPAEPEGCLRDLVHQLLAQLSPPDRLVLHLLDLEAKSVAEVSTLTGWTRAGVKVRAFRARRRLRKFVEAGPYR